MHLSIIKIINNHPNNHGPATEATTCNLTVRRPFLRIAQHRNDLWITATSRYPLYSLIFRERERERALMDLRVPCSTCTSVYRRPVLNWKLSSPKSYNNYRFSSLKCRRETTSELQAPVGVTVPAGNSYSPSIPTHRVTVHDRQRGVVHQFLVPEVPRIFLVQF